MLSVPNRTNWNNFYKQSSLKNCDVLIYDNDNNLIIDKNKIKSFKYKGTNSYVCSTFPTEQIEIELLDFSSFTTSQKSYLTKGKCLYVKYQVESTITTSGKLFVIDTLKVDMRGKNASIIAKSILESKVLKNIDVKMGLDYPNPKVKRQADDILYDIVFALGSTYFPQLSYRVGTLDNNYDCCSWLATSPLSSSELIQHLAIANGCTIKERSVWNDVSTPNRYDLFIDLKAYNSNALDLDFDSLNVYDNCDIEDYDYDYSNINVVFYIDRSSENDISPTVVLNFNSTLNEFVGEYNIINGVCYYLETIVYGTELAGYYPTQVNIYNDKIDIHFGNYPYAHSQSVSVLMHGVQGNKNSVENSITSIFADYDNLSTLQNAFRSYFAHKTYLTFDCRIDPTIEPLDIIKTTIYDIEYTIAVEEIDISFNGGFNGSIKGRIIKQVNKFMLPPELLYVDNENDGFGVYNPNIDCDLLIGLDGVGTLETIGIAEDENLDIYTSEYPSLQSAFDDYENGELEHDLYCQCLDEDRILPSSEKVIILKANANN